MLIKKLVEETTEILLLKDKENSVSEEVNFKIFSFFKLFVFFFSFIFNLQDFYFYIIFNLSI